MPACSSGPPHQAAPRHLAGPQGAREHNQPRITQLGTRPSVSGLKLCPQVGDKQLTLVSGFTSQHLEKGLQGPVEPLGITPCPPPRGKEEVAGSLHGFLAGPQAPPSLESLRQTACPESLHLSAPVSVSLNSQGLPSYDMSFLCFLGK